jgi:hypothetical protein
MISFEIKPQAVGMVRESAGGSNAKALHEFLITNSIPLVIDADALNIIKQILAFVVTVEIDIDAPSKRTRALNRKMGFRGRKIRNDPFAAL